MTNSKTTKKALLSSALALTLCVAMLIATTFAWFTDTASTSVNKIQAGTLDVALYYDDGQGTNGETNWVTAEGTTLGWKQATDASGTTTIVGTDGLPLWEPGCTFTLPDLKIVNEGNLALKYKILITGIQGDAKLNEAITWTMTLDGNKPETLGTEHNLLANTGNVENENNYDIFIISGKMKEDAGNEYQGLSIDGIGITVVATQLNSEFDSITKDYDKDATYLNKDKDGNYLIGSAAELRYFAKTVNTYDAGTTFKLTSDIDLGGAKWTPIAWTANNNGTFDGQNNTISNFKVNGQKDLGLFSYATGVTIKNLTVKNATVTGIGRVGAIVGQGICTHIESCNVADSTITAYVYNNDDGDKAGAVVGQLSAQNSASMKNCTVENCTVKAYRDLGGMAGHVQNNGSDVTGNTVKNTTVIEDLSAGLIKKGTVGKVVGRQDGGFTLNTTSNTAGDDVVVTTFDSDKVIKSTAPNANIVIEDTAVVDSSTSIGSGTTISGTGVDSTTVAVKKAKISKDNVTISDMTINGSGSSGNEGTLGINGNNTTVENVNYVGDGNIAVAVSTGQSNSGTTFKDVKITNAFRGIQFWNLSGDSLIEDCVLDVAGYTFNVDAVEADSTLTVKNTTLNGWTSYTSGNYKVSFEGCKFGLNTYQYLRPYAETEITNCEFTSDGYQLNAGGKDNNKTSTEWPTYTITLTNCTKNGTEITAENVKTLLLDTNGWNTNVTLIVNGTTVNVSQ